MNAAEQRQFIDDVNALNEPITLKIKGPNADKSLSPTEFVGAITTNTATITSNTGTITADSDQLARFDALSGAVESTITNHLLQTDAIEHQKTTLSDSMASVKGTKDVPEKYSKEFERAMVVKDPSAELLAARGLYAELKGSIKGLQDKLATGPGDLSKAISGIPGVESKFIIKLDQLAEPAYDLPADSSFSRLREGLAKQLPTLVTAVQLRYGADAKLKKLNGPKDLSDPGLQKLLPELAKGIQTAQDALDKLSANLRSGLGKQDLWYSRIIADAQDESRGAKQLLDQFIANPRQGAEAAHAQAKIGVLLVADVNAIVSAAKDLLAAGAPITKADFPANCVPSGFSVQILQDRLDTIQTAIARLNLLNTELIVSHPFDITTWESDQISLYYFDDVSRLIRVLNPDAKSIGDTSAQTAANAARASLNTASQALANARANTQDLRAVLAKRTEDLRQTRNASGQKTVQDDAKIAAAQRRADQTAAVLRNATLNQSRLQAAATAAAAEETNAKAAYTTDSANPKSDPDDVAREKVRWITAEQKTVEANRRAMDAAAETAKASSENDAAQAALATASGNASKAAIDLAAQLTSIQAKLDQAIQDEQQAEAKQRDTMTNAFLTAQADNAAFAFARDNAPFFSAIPTADQFKSDDPSINSDPIKRVMLFAFPNSRTLFIRGAEADVALVKEMIAQFDQPQAQAEMSVYSMEVGSDTTKGGVLKAIEATRQLQEELAIHNIQVDTCLTYLRQLINEYIQKENYNRSPQPPMSPAEEIKFFYDDRVLHRMGIYVAKNSGSIDATVEKYLPTFLPRPSGAATLAEALIVLALAKTQTRNEIIDRFTGSGKNPVSVADRIDKQFRNLPPTVIRRRAVDNLKRFEKEAEGSTPTIPPDGAPANGTEPLRAVRMFGNFRRLFRVDDGDTTGFAADTRDAPDVLAFQNEIIGELKDNATSSLVIELKQRYQQDSYQDDRMRAIDASLEEIRNSLVKQLNDLAQFAAQRRIGYLARNAASTALDVAIQRNKELSNSLQAKLEEYTKRLEAVATAATNQSKAQATLDAAAIEFGQAQAQRVSAQLSVNSLNAPTEKASVFRQQANANTGSLASSQLLNMIADTYDKVKPDNLAIQIADNTLKSAQTREDTLRNSLNKQVQTAPTVADGDKVSAALDNLRKDIIDAADKATKEVTQQQPPKTPAESANLDAKVKVAEALSALADATTQAKAALDKADADFKAADDAVLKEIAVVIDTCHADADEAKRKLNDRDQRILARRGDLLQTEFPAAFVLSTSNIQGIQIQDEMDTFFGAMQKSQVSNELVPQSLNKVADVLSPYTKPMASVPLELAGIVTGFVSEFNRKEQRLPAAPFAYFSRTTSGKLISQARGELRADWYQKRHVARARTNETLKRFILAFDEDVKRQFVDPLVIRLQMRLLKSDLQVGIVQKTSILASNRLVARVDPQASAALPVDQEQNILQQSLQLAQIVASTSTGGASAALTGGATGPAAAVNVLKALDGLPNDPPPGIYGITTGNVFQVTPVFDPTGQALRFRFDYVAANQVREPSGNTNPALPRIERHSINTEVQLSNYQLRTVSSFVSNAKLGRPTRYSGGIPILKNIPFINQIPLIGWFTRSGGQAAVVQQSFVLAHTSMYPTIQDVIGALVQPSGIPEADFTLPKQLTPDTSTQPKK
jgi:hypothetical protein